MRIGHLAPLLVAVAAISVAEPVNSISCGLGPYIVFFEQDDAKLDAEDRRVLNSLLRAEGDCGFDFARVVGHSDISENEQIAGRRAEVVAHYLSEHGWTPNKIASTDLGATNPRRLNSGPEPEPDNRRVEIYLEASQEEVMPKEQTRSS